MTYGRKKGGGRAPTEGANTLRSTQIAEVQILISEGEAQGLVNGLKSVYLDGVPLQNQNGTFNFEGVEFAYFAGTQGQPALPGLATVQNEVAVAVQVVQATPVTRTITDAEVDHVRVTLNVPQLTVQDTTTGDLLGSEFEFTVEIQANGAGFVERHRETVKGKTTSNYSKAVRIELGGVAPWDVRVKRITVDPPAAHIVNQFSWASYTEIVSVKLRYPNSAVAGLRVGAESFNRLPTVAFDWLGQRIKLPSNYNPLTRVYTGTWNGTFTTAWSNNPAWVLYDLVTHPRYGLGQFVAPGLLNKWALYAIGQYCDTLVPDGRGGSEPRFTCNLELNTRAEAFNVLQDLASIFRGLVFWAGDAVEFCQDAPADAVLPYAPANVVDGLFTYSDSSEKTKHSMFVCWWTDLSQFGKRVPEVYIDETLVARYGVRELELQPLGVTSRGQAARVCRWARHSEQLEGEVITFEVGSDGVAASLGQVFKVADPSEAGERLGGRISSATASAVTLDAQVTLAGGEAYTLTVLQPDPAAATGLLSETRAVTNAAGAATVITLATPFSAAPVAQTVWLLESTGIAATLWRCISVEEVAGANRFRVTGMAHNPSKYAAIEDGLKLDQRPISRLRLSPPRPASMATAETVYKTGHVYRSRVTVSWPEPNKGLLYALSWRLNGGAWTALPVQSANSADIDGLAAGTLDLELRSANGLGNTSLPLAASIAVTGAGQLVLDAVLVAGVSLGDMAAATVDFNASNNRNAGAVAAPTLPADGTAIDHTLQADGSADISFEWFYAASEGEIDGFIVTLYQSASAAAYTMGTTPAAETAYVLPASKRAFILFGTAANAWYTFGVRAYRKVDADVAGQGVLQSAVVQSAVAGENPYRPSASVAFAGNVTGTVNGIAASDVNIWAAIGGSGKPENFATVGAVAGSNLLDSNGRVTSDPRLLGNLLNAGAWVVGSTGSQPGFVAIEDTSESAIVIAAAPDNTHRALWRATSSDGTLSADGGWDSVPVAIDATKQYRTSVWIKATGVLDGNYYLGLGGSTVNDIGGGVNANPYCHAGSRGGLTAGRWYLLTGFVMPSGYSGAQLNLGGVYDGTTGQRVADGTDFRWVVGQPNGQQRAYQYYASAGAVQDFYDPRFELCNGNELSISELLKVAGTEQIALAAVTDGGTAMSGYSIAATQADGAAGSRATLFWYAFGAGGAPISVTVVGTGRPMLIDCSLGAVVVNSSPDNAPATATLGMRLYDGATSLREALINVPLTTVVNSIGENDGGGHGTYDFMEARAAFAFTHEVAGFTGSKTFSLRRGYNLINTSGVTVAPGAQSWKCSIFGGGSITAKEYKR